jgi:hypothetical protein
MKHFIIILLGLFFCHAAFAQADSTACLNYQKGYFSYIDSTGNTVLVHRRKKYQYDKNTVTKVRTQFRLDWKDNCSYQITQAITNSKAARKFKNSSTIVVIAKTDGDNGYTYTCECKDGTKIKSGYMKKLTKQQYYDLL